jgi:hypothetical protein
MFLRVKSWQRNIAPVVLRLDKLRLYVICSPDLLVRSGLH